MYTNEKMEYLKKVRTKVNYLVDEVGLKPKYFSDKVDLTTCSFSHWRKDKISISKEKVQALDSICVEWLKSLNTELINK